MIGAFSTTHPEYADGNRPPPRPHTDGKYQTGFLFGSSDRLYDERQAEKIRRLYRSWLYKLTSWQQRTLTLVYIVIGSIGLLTMIAFLVITEILYHYPVYEVPLRSISFGGLAWHVYGIIFYLVVFVFGLIPVFRHKALGMVMILWAINETTFNLTYVLRYPSAFNVMLTYVHYWFPYLLSLNALGILAFFIVRPKVKFHSLTLLLPIYCVVWFVAGVPIMEPFSTPIIPHLPQNFFWELGFQISLVVTFFATFKDITSQRNPNYTLGMMTPP